MPSSHDPVVCLADIIENIERIGTYVGGMDRDGFQRDGRTRDAVERCLERICEAAVRLEDHAATLMPDQPWADIRGMGHHLRHGYDRISVPIIWNAIRVELPALENDVRRALARLERGSGRVSDNSP